MEEKFSLDEALKRIRFITETLQSDKTDLDTSMALYKESLSLIAACRKNLDQAEIEFEKIKSDAS